MHAALTAIAKGEDTIYWGLQNLCTMKAQSSNQALLTDYCVRGHKIILSHLICQIRNALCFLDFASWCKDSAIPSSLLDLTQLIKRRLYYMHAHKWTHLNESYGLLPHEMTQS